MASIKISNLPSLMAPSLSDNDYFIVNDENQTTSKLQFTEFVKALGNQDYTFSGAVNFTGSVSVNIVDELNSNIYTKASVDALIAESEARDNVKILANATDINQLQNLLPAPTSGGLFLAGTFSGAASTATQVVTAINLVSDKVTADAADLTTLEGSITTINSELASLRTDLTATDNSVGVGDADTLAAAALYSDGVAADASTEAKLYADALVADNNLQVVDAKDLAVLADSKTYTDAEIVTAVSAENAAMLAAVQANNDLIGALTARVIALETA